MAGTFCVTVTHCRTDGDKATLAFVVANAALGSEKDTMVFLSSDGVWCAVKGEAEKVNEGPPFAPLKELIDKFVAGGGKISRVYTLHEKARHQPGPADRRRHPGRRRSTGGMALQRVPGSRILTFQDGCES